MVVPQPDEDDFCDDWVPDDDLEGPYMELMAALTQSKCLRRKIVC